MTKKKKTSKPYNPLAASGVGYIRCDFSEPCQPKPSVCPSCGHCPTCGRSDTQSYPGIKLGCGWGDSFK